VSQTFVAHLRAEWRAAALAERTGPTVAQVVPAASHLDTPTLLLNIALPRGGRMCVSVRVVPEGPHIGERELPVAWGMERLGPGVWTLDPSIIVGDVHAFVTLVGVPEPAPWR
jgi:hypothetical protein